MTSAEEAIIPCNLCDATGYVPDKYRLQPLGPTKKVCPWCQGFKVIRVDKKKIPKIKQ